MKRRIDEERLSGPPMFPRLHVKDADKGGGPRAPPRNKMALYEQLSIPSQRFDAGPVPLHSHMRSVAASVPSASCSQGFGHERSFPSPIYVHPQTPACSSERTHSRSSNATKLDSRRTEFERSTKHESNKTLNVMEPLTESSMFQPYHIEKKSSDKKFDYDDDFRVPTLFQSGVSMLSSKKVIVAEPERLTPFCGKNGPKNINDTQCSSIPDSSRRSLEETYASKTKSGNYDQNHCEEQPETSIKEEPPKTSKSRSASAKGFAKMLNSATPSFDQDHTCTLNTFQSSHNVNDKPGQEPCRKETLRRHRCIDVVEKDDASSSRFRNDICPTSLHGNGPISLNVADNRNKQSGTKASGSFEIGDPDRTDEVSETSMVDSLPGMGICPDVVVGVIGPKHFWKARRAILNQQRIFAMQVFELHRLIKVQKLIAASPNLLEENSSLGRSPPEVPTDSRPPEPIMNWKDNSQKTDEKTEHRGENKIGDMPLPARENEFGKELLDRIPTTPYFGHPPPLSSTPDNKASPWCINAPPNQWLVPVMSPSEGLIYKPYTGACPPTAGFVAPIYGNYSPLPLPPVTGDFMNTAYSDPASLHRQNMGALSGATAIPPKYIPSHCGLPFMNQLISGSDIEQGSSLAGLRPPKHAEQYSRISSNWSNARKGNFSGFMKFQASKDYELQGSTASSPCEKAPEASETLPLFPTQGAESPTRSHAKDNPTRVIKVVPRHARSATESVARIFKSIQEGRQRFDL